MERWDAVTVKMTGERDSLDRYLIKWVEIEWPHTPMSILLGKNKLWTIFNDLDDGVGTTVGHGQQIEFLLDQHEMNFP